MAKSDCKCSVKNCRNEGEVKYLDKWLCDKHWEKDDRRADVSLAKKRKPNINEKYINSGCEYS